jgi:hypothetical protein
MEQSISSESQTTETPNIQTIEASQANITTNGNFEKGGFLDKFKDFKWVNILVGSLLITASVYSIYYHKQALEALYATDEEDSIERDIEEIRSNLKRIMGRNYAIKS